MSMEVLLVMRCCASTDWLMDLTRVKIAGEGHSEAAGS